MRGHQGLTQLLLQGRSWDVERVENGLIGKDLRLPATVLNAVQVGGNSVSKNDEESMFVLHSDPACAVAAAALRSENISITAGNGDGSNEKVALGAGSTFVLLLCRVAIGTSNPVINIGGCSISDAARLGDKLTSEIPSDVSEGNGNGMCELRYSENGSPSSSGSVYCVHALHAARILPEDLHRNRRRRLELNPVERAQRGE